MGAERGAERDREEDVIAEAVVTRPCDPEEKELVTLGECSGGGKKLVVAAHGRSHAS